MLVKGNVIRAILAAFALVVLAASGAWKTYEGPWFSIEYPPGFKAVADKSHPDSARFRSPAGEVEFYVYSPQWNGEPDGIALDPATEKIKDDKTEKKDDKEVRWYTIIAKDGNYRRSYVDTTDHLSNTRLVFGIKYRDEAALDKYGKDYARFKGSIQQFAD